MQTLPKSLPAGEPVSLPAEQHVIVSQVRGGGAGKIE
jgi:hypothetical protein